MKPTCQVFLAKAGVDQTDSLHCTPQQYFLLCLVTLCCYISTRFLLLHSFSLPFFYIPKCHSLFILVLATLTLFLAWTEITVYICISICQKQMD